MMCKERFRKEIEFARSLTCKNRLDWLIRQYRKFKEADAKIKELQEEKRMKEAQLQVCQAARQVAIDRSVELAKEKLEVKAELADVRLQLHPTPPSYTEVVLVDESYASLREIFPIQLIYGLDDPDDEIPLYSDFLQACAEMKIYEYLYIQHRRDCENFSRGAIGRLALAPGWSGILKLELHFRRPAPPFGMEGHSEVLVRLIDNREPNEDGDGGMVKRWFVVEMQALGVLELAGEMFEDDTGREAYLMK